MTCRARSVRASQTALVIMLLGALCSTAQGQQSTKNWVDIQSLFTPSGWMGDGEYGRRYIEFTGADKLNPHSPPYSIKFTYRFGPAGWGGVYWLNQPDNWGDESGTDYSGREFSRVTFWARGEHGGEVIEFKAGGIHSPTKKYRDSFVATSRRISLTRDWRQYRIDLTQANLRSVIGGFCWVASKDYNSEEQITFHLDDIILE